MHHAVSGKRMRRTLLPSVHSSESGVEIRSHHASDLLLVFAAVKKMAPSSREAIGREVPDACILCGVSWCRLVCNVLLFTVSILSCIQTRFSRLRPRTRTRPTHYMIQPNTTTGWLFASGSSWTLGHTGGSRLWVHRCPKGKAVRAAR